jgi:hypothetical protein
MAVQARGGSRRALVCAALLASASACSRASLSSVGGDAGNDGFLVFHRHANRKLDLLFMVDNSVGMSKAQENLRANLPRFLDVLKSLPDGLPDMHVAVVSSDMGVGNDNLPTCNSTGGDRGVFHNEVGQNAVGRTETGLVPGARFVATTGGANPQNNFTGDITEVLQCILPLGTAGCGFERPLASIARALGADGAPAPSENHGFLRPDAHLAIVLVTDEDDCSAASEAFYDVVTNVGLASPLGPPGGFRCSEFGHLCDGAPPRRLAPNGKVTDTVSYSTCVPAEEAGLLTPVARFVQGIRALKADPTQISVSSIQGPTTPYVTHWKSPQLSGDGPWPEN